MANATVASPEADIVVDGEKTVVGERPTKKETKMTQEITVNGKKEKIVTKVRK